MPRSEMDTSFSPPLLKYMDIFLLVVPARSALEAITESICNPEKGLLSISKAYAVTALDSAETITLSTIITAITMGTALFTVLLVFAFILYPST